MKNKTLVEVEAPKPDFTYKQPIKTLESKRVKAPDFKK